MYNIMQTDTAFLELDTYVLAGTSNINATKTTYVFRNIDLKSVMGEMWNKYEKFAIRLQSVRYAAGTSNTGSQANNLQINLKGLDWVNCYDEKFGSSQVYIPICSINGSNASRSVIPVTSHYCFNFRKGQRIVDLEFNVTTLITNIADPTVAPGALTLMPDQIFTFNIQPAENNQNEIGYMGFYTNPTNNPIQWPSKVVSDSSRTYTYYGFNMRDVCREFWDKYEDFEIVMAGYTNQGYGGATSDGIPMPLQMSGFNWVNNYSKQGNTYSSVGAIVGLLQGPTGGSSHLNDFTSFYSPVQFKKSGDLVNIQLQVRNFDNSGLNLGLPSSGVRVAYWPFFVRPVKRGLNPEKALLSISSADLTETMTDAGIRNANWTDITIKNIDLRQACESFWNKYEKFNIFFTGMCNYVTTVTTTNWFLDLNCDGLQLNPQVASNNPQSTNQVWNIGAVQVNAGPTAASPSVSYGNTHSTTFYKSGDKVDLRFYVNNLANPTTAVTSQYLRGTMTFTIVGVDE
jgi:hypothetical protein